MEGREQAGATYCVTATRTTSALAVFALAVYALRWLLWRFGGALADKLPRTSPARAPDVTACFLAEMRDGDGVVGWEREEKRVGDRALPVGAAAAPAPRPLHAGHLGWRYLSRPTRQMSCHHVGPLGGICHQLYSKKFRRALRARPLDVTTRL